MSNGWDEEVEIDIDPTKTVAQMKVKIMETMKTLTSDAVDVMMDGDVLYGEKTL